MYFAYIIEGVVIITDGVSEIRLAADKFIAIKAEDFVNICNNMYNHHIQSLIMSAK